MSYAPLVADAPVLGSARVTLDVLHSGIIWGWFVTMNMWAKSLGTGAVLVGAWMMRRYPAKAAFYRLWLALVGFAMINVTLLFTWLDLHQKLRFWHMFTHPHFTSSVNIGAWLLTAITATLALMILAEWKKQEALYARLLAPAVVLAFFTTIYTAALMGQASARETWSTATEVPQTLLAATLAGAAVYLLIPGPDREEQMSLAGILGLSAAVTFTIYLAEVVFAPARSDEAAFIILQLTRGPLRALFCGGLALGFVVPGGIVVWCVLLGTPRALRFAAAASLAGLWMVKHAWLLAPQLIPLS